MRIAKRKPVVALTAEGKISRKAKLRHARDTLRPPTLCLCKKQIEADAGMLMGP
jgi:hypothetical protein